MVVGAVFHLRSEGIGRKGVSCMEPFLPAALTAVWPLDVPESIAQDVGLCSALAVGVLYTFEPGFI